jgi:hypothetical protein
MKGLTLFLQAAAPRNYCTAITGAFYSIPSVSCARSVARPSVRPPAILFLLQRERRAKCTQPTLGPSRLPAFAPNFHKSARCEIESGSIINRCGALSDLLSAANNTGNHFSSHLARTDLCISLGLADQISLTLDANLQHCGNNEP